MEIMKNGDLLAAANEKIRLSNSKKKNLGDKLILALLVAVCVFLVFMFWKHKAGL